MTGRVTVVAALGTTQTIAWASSYYMPAIHLPPRNSGSSQRQWSTFGDLPFLFSDVLGFSQ